MLVRGVSKTWVTRAEVQRRHAECGEPRDVGPSEFRPRIRPDCVDKVHGCRPLQSRARARRLIDDRDLVPVEHCLHMLNRLSHRPVGSESKVDRHGALVRDDIARDAPADPHCIEALAVLEAVDHRTCWHVVMQPTKNLGCIMHRIDTHPRASAVRSHTGDSHVDPNRALAPCLDTCIGRLHEDREIGFEQLGSLVGEMLEAVEL